MKEDELRKVAECGICHKKIGASGLPLFWRVRLERYGLNTEACSRQQGLGMMISPAIARVMGPDENLADKIDSVEITVCETCAGKQTSVYQMAMQDDPEEDEDNEDN